MLALHVLAAVLATWRLTDLVTTDRITAGLRARWPLYLWTCPRCVSVWAGVAVTGLFLLSPWLTWPFALAWTYLWRAESRAARALTALDVLTQENARLRAEIGRGHAAIFRVTAER